MKSSGSGSASAGAGESPVDDGDVEITESKIKVEQHDKYVSLRDLIRSESEVQDSSAVELQESSESDGGGETEPRLIRPRIFPSKFIDQMKKSDNEDDDEELISIQFRVLAEEEASSLLLTAEEEAALISGTGIPVMLIEPDGQTVNSSLTLQRRPRMQRGRYILTGAWSDLVARYSDALERGRLVRIWWFRRRHVGRQRLWFALEVVDEPPRAVDCQLAFHLLWSI